MWHCAQATPANDDAACSENVFCTSSGRPSSNANSWQVTQVAATLALPMVASCGAAPWHATQSTPAVTPARDAAGAWQLVQNACSLGSSSARLFWKVSSEKAMRWKE